MLILEGSVNIAAAAAVLVWQATTAVALVGSVREVLQKPLRRMVMVCG
jgi:predicted DCC family thiol-disulfide oxidoreductase YuxK